MDVSSAPPPHNPGQGFVRRHGAKLIASAVITCGIVYTLHKGGIKFIPDSGDFRGITWWTLPVYFVMTAVMNYFRAIRWRFLLRSFAEIPRQRLLAVSWIGFAAILLMPFRIGEIVRPYMIRQKGKISMTAAAGSVVAERIVDGLYLSVVLAIALVFVPTAHPLPDRVFGLPPEFRVSVQDARNSGYAMLGLFAVAFATIAIFYFARGFARRFTMLTVGLVSKGLAERLARLFEKFADGLKFLGNVRDAAGFLLETTVYWGLNAAGMWLLGWGTGIVHADGSPMTFGESCALMGMLGVTILIPGPPGLLGVFQLGLFTGMTMYFAEPVIAGRGAAYVFLCYFIQFVWTLLAAAYYLATDKRNWRALEQADGASVPAATEV